MPELFNKALNRKVCDLRQAYKSDRLELGPDYQRYEVWTMPKKQEFIDSVIRGFAIPQIYLREVNGKYEVVDGQQRLRSLFGYLGELGENSKFKLSSKSEDINGVSIAGLKVGALSNDVYEKINNFDFSVVELCNYSDEQVANYFVRLQNGSKLTYAERRRGYISRMRGVVFELSEHAFFDLCGFENKRCQNEDFIGKLFHLFKHNMITAPTYTNVDRDWIKNRNIDCEKDKTVKKIRKVFDFVYDVLSNSDLIGGKNLRFPTYFALSFCLTVDELLDTTNIRKCKGGFMDCIETILADIDIVRKKCEEGKIDECNPLLVKYNSNARSDKLTSIKARCDVILGVIEKEIHNLAKKDPQRFFTIAQRAKIYKKDKGVCQKCHEKCTADDFCADHIRPHSKGGPTSVENGQVLCGPCNLAKGDKDELPELKFFEVGGIKT